MNFTLSSTNRKQVECKKKCSFNGIKQKCHQYVFKYIERIRLFSINLSRLINYNIKHSVWIPLKKFIFDIWNRVNSIQTHIVSSIHDYT